MKVSAQDLTDHFKKHAPEYGVIVLSTFLGATFGAAASDIFEYGHDVGNTTLGAFSGFLCGTTLSFMRKLNM